MSPRSIADLNAASLEQMRVRFLERMPDFGDFTARSGTYWEEERGYKVEFSQLSRRVLSPSLFEDGGSDAPDRIIAALLRVLTSTLRSAKGPQNLLPWRYVDVLRRLAAEDRVIFGQALGELLYRRAPAPDRVGAFNDATWRLLQRAAGGNPYAISRTLPTMLLMGLEPADNIAIRTDLFDNATEVLLGSSLLKREPLTSAGYRQLLEFATSVRHQLEVWAWLPQDLIDVHSFLWVGTAPSYGGAETDDAEPSDKTEA